MWLYPLRIIMMAEEMQLQLGVGVVAATGVVVFAIFAKTAVAFFASLRILPTQQNENGQQNLSKQQKPQDKVAPSPSGLRRKLEFMRRVGDLYGYASSPAGHIDSWRANEFPSLVAPYATRAASFCHGGSDATPHEMEVYLDYAGAALASRSQLRNVFEEMSSSLSILGNPHSLHSGPASARTSTVIEQAKKLILDHFNCHPDHNYQYGNANGDGDLGGNNGTSMKASDLFGEPESHPGYDLIFVSGTTEALRIVASSFPWTTGSTKLGPRSLIEQMSSLLLYPHNAHTSVIGMRNLALKAGGSFQCMRLSDISSATESHFDNWVGSHKTLNSDDSNDEQVQPKEEDQFQEISHLLVLPLECNFGGDKTDAQSIFRTVRTCNARWSREKKRSTPKHVLYTMLDMARAASHSMINLKDLDPDFACISFYKMFGFPTGLGALFVKRSAGMRILTGRQNATLTKPNCSSTCKNEYFGGGSVDAVLADTDFVVPRSDLSSCVHGTVHYRGIASLPHGFREIVRVGGMNQIDLHCGSLAAELVRRLIALRHGNDRPAVHIYGVWNKASQDLLHGEVDLHQMPGPTVVFNLVRHDGSFVGYNEVAKLATLNRPPIQLRTGCFCNPGACQEALSVNNDTIKENFFRAGHVCGDNNDIISGVPTGAVRASFGKESCFEDMDVLVCFIERVFVNRDREDVASKLQISHRPHPQEESQTCRISEVYVYPIKSCAPLKVKSWKISKLTGRLEFDREFALVDASGTAMRMYAYPEMAKIHPIIDVDERQLVVTAPACDKNLVLDLDDDTLSFGKGPWCVPDRDIKVCGNVCLGKVFGSQAASEWFSSLLGVKCWLVRHNGKDMQAPPKANRLSSRSSSRSHVARDRSLVAFANEAPILLITQASVDILNQVLHEQGESPVGSRHFRPNLVVSVDSLPTSTSSIDNNINPEDTWSHLEVVGRDLRFSVVGPCARCAMVDVDPTTCTKGNTLRALSEYRRKKSQIIFGVFLRSSREESALYGEEGTKSDVNEGDAMLVKR